MKKRKYIFPGKKIRNWTIDTTFKIRPKDQTSDMSEKTVKTSIFDAKTT